ncbi:MAG: zinc metallopeptidase [SAR324 cluster bacterium]|nr:zinc metallopeptidase [SAR324 cluster bacterium]
MLFLIMLIIISFVLLLQLPSIWIKRVYKEYNYSRDDIIGSGGQFAKHLINKNSMHEVEVLEHQTSNFYDHKKKIIYLSKDIFNQHSVTSITIASHEFSHAKQAHEKNPLFLIRNFFQIFLFYARFVMIVIFFGSLVAGFLLGQRWLLSISILCYVLPGIAELMLSILNLPLEWDASFKRAHPLIINSRYLPDDDDGKIKKILFAALLTYVAAALSNLLSLVRTSPFARIRR